MFKSCRSVLAVVLVVLVVLLALVVAMSKQQRRWGGGAPKGGRPRAPKDDRPQVLYVPDKEDVKPTTFVRMGAKHGYAVVKRAQGPLAVGFVRDWRAKQPWKGTKADVWGRLAADAISNKASFLHLFGGESGVAPAGWVVPPYPEKARALPEGVWMFRPEKGWGGWHARAVTSDAQLEELRRQLAEGAPRLRGVVTRYIADPDLFTFRGQKYKYHLRVWALAASDGKSPLRLGYFRRARLVHALAPYRQADFANADVHDTHSHGDGDVTADYPEKFGGDHRPVDAEIARLMAAVKPTFAKVLKPIPTARAGFHLLGLDIMIDAGGRGWLLEVNTGPTFPTLRRDISREIYEALWLWAILPLRGEGEPTAPEGFVEVE